MADEKQQAILAPTAGVGTGTIALVAKLKPLLKGLEEIKRQNLDEPLAYLFNWGRLYSLWPVHLETACCLPPSEKVSKGREWVPVEQVNTRSQLINHLGSPTPVKRRITHDYNGLLVTIKPLVSPYNTIRLTAEHPVLAIKKDRFMSKCHLNGGDDRHKNHKAILNEEPKFHPAQFIEKGDLLIYCVDQRVADNGTFSSPLLELMGYYLAEGYTVRTTSHRYIVEFSFSAQETELIERTTALIVNLFSRKPWVFTRRNVTYLRFFSKEACDFFENHCAKYAEAKILSEEVMLLPPEKQRILLEAYQKGDGNIHTDRRSTEYKIDRISTASERLAVQIQEIVARFGSFAYIKYRASNGTGVIEGRKVRISPSYEIEFRLNGKASKKYYYPSKYGIAIPVKAVSKEWYTGPVYNFTTGHPNTFLVKGFATHNCSVEWGASAGARWDLERFGILEAFGSLRQCDLLVVLGTVNRKMAPRLKMVWDQMPEPKWCIAAGACAISGGLYVDSYNVLQGVDQIIPVDVFVPGCPPTPIQILEGVVLLQEKIRRSNIYGKYVEEEPHRA